MISLLTLSPALILLIAACLLSRIAGPENPENPPPAPIDVENVPVRTVAVDDIEIAYRAFGEGPPLVLIMGFAGTLDMWGVRALQEFARSYRVIVFDNRGMGRSTSSGKEYTVSLCADDTAGLMAALGIEEAHVLGWSMGADIALELARRHPERVAKLVLYAADPGGDESVPLNPAVEAQLLDTSGTDIERGMRLLSLLFPAEWMAKHPDPREYFPNVTESSSPAAIARQGGAMGARTGVSAWLGSITQPTLLIVGSVDVIAPPQNSFFIGERIPSAWVVQVRGAGHGLMYQFPAEFAAVVHVFLERAW
ncbi:MAG: alpha/beta hydrolase [Methanomicrobiales archaeon]|nr:alpha/beta hydrolase [Methanomicrobiales archaeon]